MPLSKAKAREYNRLHRLKVKYGDDIPKALLESPAIEAKRVLTIEERKLLLTKYALRGNKKLINPTVAIDLLCKLDGAYAPEKREDTVRVASFVFVMPDGTDISNAILGVKPALVALPLVPSESTPVVIDSSAGEMIPPQPVDATASMEVDIATKQGKDESAKP